MPSVSASNIRVWRNLGCKSSYASAFRIASRILGSLTSRWSAFEAPEERAPSFRRSKYRRSDSTLWVST